MKVIIDKIFKSGDRVYHYLYGWGIVINMGNDIEFDNQLNLVRDVFELRNFLSFTEYTLEGFSQERPEELPKKGQIVWVRDDLEDEWRVTHFIGKIGQLYRACTFFSDESGSDWFYMTTENPYKDE